MRADYKPIPTQVKTPRNKTLEAVSSQLLAGDELGLRYLEGAEFPTAFIQQLPAVSYEL